jgi:hypothetical protein
MCQVSKVLHFNINQRISATRAEAASFLPPSDSVGYSLQGTHR